MGHELYNATELGRQYFDLANDILNVDIKDITFNGPEEVLKQTLYTQPAIYIVSVILGQLFIESGTDPVAVAGHSLGEYSAMTIAGAFDFSTGLELVKIRADSMQNVGEQQPGTMAAVIGIDGAVVEKVCCEAHTAGTVVAANFNAPGQVVISGSIKGVRAAMKIARDFGARKVVELNVSGAFHSPLMKPARSILIKKLADTAIQDPQIPVYSNVTAEPVLSAVDVRQALINQLENPVQWQRSISNMSSTGIDRFVEVGPGRVLQGLIRRINRELTVYGVETIADISNFKDV